MCEESCSACSACRKECCPGTLADRRRHLKCSRTNSRPAPRGIQVSLAGSLHKGARIRLFAPRPTELLLAFRLIVLFPVVLVVFIVVPVLIVLVVVLLFVVLSLVVVADFFPLIVQIIILVEVFFLVVVVVEVIFLVVVVPVLVDRKSVV